MWVSTRKIVIVHVIDTAQGATTRYKLYEYEYNPSTNPIWNTYLPPSPAARLHVRNAHTLRHTTPPQHVTAGSPSPS
jgi:hypothetical protein